MNPKSYAIVGQGYNGMPYGCDDDVFPWGVGSQDPTENKELYGMKKNQRNPILFTKDLKRTSHGISFF